MKWARKKSCQGESGPKAQKMAERVIVQKVARQK